ncbi:hypothetical protein SO694_00004352 [Aureococcus anophagefferens]|uniref:Serine aminopeptidase S33 domain-containing protein n=1 Tax=Aureococcus anophagefferens TaxID=44056 RepID=A0ABR1G955_AURAN
MMRSSAAVQDCLAVAAASALIGFYLGYRRRARRDAADASEQESQPDYGDPDAWYAHYILKDGDRWAPPTYVDEQDRAAADAFFVHGTTALRGSQRGGSSSRGGEAAFDVAFADVAAALELFLTKHRRPGRPWILAGHSQGAGHATLAERAERSVPAEMADLVVALPLGIQHGADSLPPGLRFAGGPATSASSSSGIPSRRAARTRRAGRRRRRHVANTAVTRVAPFSMNPLTLCGGRQGGLGVDGNVRAACVKSAAVEGGVTIATAGADDFGALFPSADGDLHARLRALVAQPPDDRRAASTRGSRRGGRNRRPT